MSKDCKGRLKRNYNYGLTSRRDILFKDGEAKGKLGAAGAYYIPLIRSQREVGTILSVGIRIQDK